MEAALAVFSALFGTDPSPLVKGARTTSPPRAAIPISSQHSEQMEFLRAFIEFEQTLVALVGHIQPRANRAGPSVPEMWQAATDGNGSLRGDSDRVIEIVRILNKLVHGHSDSVTADQLVEAFVFLCDLTDRIKQISPW